MKYLLIIADIDEFVPFKASLAEKGIKIADSPEKVGDGCKFTYNNCEITVLCCGIGKVNAAAGTAYMLAKENFDGVINTGWSGAISKVHKGDILVSDSCVECDFDFTVLGKKPGEKPCQDIYIFNCDSPLADRVRSIEGFTHGKLGTGDIFLSDSRKAQEYKGNFGINAFDMESAAIASVCHFTGVPFVSVRKISDNADDTAATEYRDILFSDMAAFSDIVLKILDALNK